MSGLLRWMESGAYLPRRLRDFHDQKELFKAIHETIKPPKNGNDIMEKVSWVDGHIYVIDIFLWFMARRGYTLQRSRVKHDFLSLDDTIKQCNARREAAFTAALTEGLKSIRATDSGEVKHGD